MKVLHVLHAFPPETAPGGTERTVIALARAMLAAGHDVAVIAGSLTVAPSSRIDEQRFDDGTGAALRVLRMHRQDVHFESWEKAWSPRVGEAFRGVLRAERPDVVHVHHWIRLTTDLVRLARDEGVPVVACTLHDYWTQTVDPARLVGDDAPVAPPAAAWVGDDERAEAFALHRADLLDEVRAAHLRFAPSRAHADGLASFADGPLGEVFVSPPPLLDRPARRAVGAERGRRLLFWGSVYPDKGLDVVLDALFSVQSGWELHVFGEAHDVAYRERLQRRSARMPVTFHGRFEVRDLASAPGDYAVLPSICHESYGLVLDEARCLGLPVLASDLPAFREHCDPAATAFFEPNDPGSLAMLLCDEQRLSALREPADPMLPTPAGEAAALLARYSEARSGAHGPLPLPPTVAPTRRAAHLFARAERRLWSALQHPPILPPPPAYP
ncbi:MAG: glycosyltransferase [Planctomycetes bacterium]|nr:glycosyltransferase [Planctomycetota bacterium]